jgi:hypothetical protein
LLDILFIGDGRRNGVQAMYLTRNLVLCSALLLAMSVLAPAADNTRGAVEQSGGNVVPQNPSPPQLHLNDAQRERIRQTLLTKHTPRLSSGSKRRKPPKISTRKLAPNCRQASSRMAFRQS